MIFFPDILGSYQKGREEGIRNNWRDLASYEQIEQQRNQNDRMALQNNLLRAELPLNVSLLADKASTSQRGQLIEQASVGGLIDRAKLNSAQAKDDLNLYTNNHSNIFDARNNNLNAELGKMNLNSSAQDVNTQLGMGQLVPYQAKDKNGNTEAYNMGVRSGNVEHNKQDALLASQEKNRKLERGAIDIQNTANTLIPTAKAALEGTIAENQLNSVNGQPAPVTTIARNRVDRDVVKSKTDLRNAEREQEAVDPLWDKTITSLKANAQKGKYELNSAVPTVLHDAVNQETRGSKLIKMQGLLESDTPPEQYMLSLAEYYPQLFKDSQDYLEKRGRGDWQGSEEAKKIAEEAMQKAPDAPQPGDVTTGNSISVGMGGDGAAPSGTASSGGSTTASGGGTTTSGGQRTPSTGSYNSQTGSYMVPTRDIPSQQAYINEHTFTDAKGKEITEEDKTSIFENIQDVKSAIQGNKRDRALSLFTNFAKEHKNLIPAYQQVANQIDEPQVARITKPLLDEMGIQPKQNQGLPEPLNRSVTLRGDDAANAQAVLNNQNLAAGKPLSDSEKDAVAQQLGLSNSYYDTPPDAFTYVRQEYLKNGNTEAVKQIDRLRDEKSISRDRGREDIRKEFDQLKAIEKAQFGDSFWQLQTDSYRRRKSEEVLDWIKKAQKAINSGNEAAVRNNFSKLYKDGGEIVDSYEKSARAAGYTQVADMLRDRWGENSKRSTARQRSNNGSLIEQPAQQEPTEEQPAQQEPTEEQPDQQEPTEEQPEANNTSLIDQSTQPQQSAQESLIDPQTAKNIANKYKMDEETVQIGVGHIKKIQDDIDSGNIENSRRSIESLRSPVLRLVAMDIANAMGYKEVADLFSQGPGTSILVSRPVNQSPPSKDDERAQQNYVGDQDYGVSVNARERGVLVNRVRRISDALSSGSPDQIQAQVKDALMAYHSGDDPAESLRLYIGIANDLGYPEVTEAIMKYGVPTPGDVEAQFKYLADAGYDSLFSPEDPRQAIGRLNSYQSDIAIHGKEETRRRIEKRYKSHIEEMANAVQRSAVRRIWRSFRGKAYALGYIQLGDIINDVIDKDDK